MFRHRCIALVFAFSAVAANGGVAQQSTDTRRAQATRAELEASLVDIEKVVSSSGYSGRIRNAKKKEAALIRDRLTNGDLQVGDDIDLKILGETTLTSKFKVGSGQTLSLPSLPDIALKGVLRSETQAYLTDQLKKYFKDPVVQVTTNIRLSIFGAVARPGFYQCPAESLAGDAIMQCASGLGGNADPTKMSVKRGGQEIWSNEAFQDAIARGLTLDQLSLRAGDELFVDDKGTGTGFKGVLLYAAPIISVIFLLTRVGRII